MFVLFVYDLYDFLVHHFFTLVSIYLQTGIKDNVAFSFHFKHKVPPLKFMSHGLVC